MIPRKQPHSVGGGGSRRNFPVAGFGGGGVVAEFVSLTPQTDLGAKVWKAMAPPAPWLRHWHGEVFRLLYYVGPYGIPRREGGEYFIDIGVTSSLMRTTRTKRTGSEVKVDIAQLKMQRRATRFNCQSLRTDAIL